MIPVLLNTRSGAGLNGDDYPRLQAIFREAGLDARLTPARANEDIGELTRRELAQDPPLLVAGGGDGTINAVAGALRGTQTALGVLPIGTLNHFAKDLGIPTRLESAVQVIAAGRRIHVDAGDVNGKCFLNNSSLGLYPDVVRERTRQQRRLGRSKRAAMVWATLATLDRSRLLELRLELEDRSHTCRAPFVFVGNNQYRMEGFDIGTRERLDEGRLSIYTTQRCTAGGLAMLFFHALFGKLRQAEDFTALRARTLGVETRHRRLAVATDGEVSFMETPLKFTILPRALSVLVP
jgi:diacylglycerol kinase family enzyme